MQAQQLATAANEYIQTLSPPEMKTELTVVDEITFSHLKFEAQRGAKLGDFEIAHKTANIEDKWQNAYNILRNNNATINDRYHGDTYQYSYWLFGQDKIYRQKLKSK